MSSTGANRGWSRQLPDRQLTNRPFLHSGPYLNPHDEVAQSCGAIAAELQGGRLQPEIEVGHHILHADMGRGDLGQRQLRVIMM